MMMKLGMMRLKWVLALVTGHLVKWLLRQPPEIKVCLSVPFDHQDDNDDGDDDHLILKKLKVCQIKKIIKWLIFRKCFLLD